MEGGLDLYLYTENNPINAMDSSGLYAIDQYGNPIGYGGPSKRKYHTGIKSSIQDFIENYQKMKEANVIGADRYFHCMANCKASRRGIGGRAVAITISAGRELLDFPKNIVLKKMTIKESLEDLKGDLAANKLGRDACEGVSCDDTCRPLIPPSSRPFIPKP